MVVENRFFKAIFLEILASFISFVGTLNATKLLGKHVPISVFFDCCQRKDFVKKCENKIIVLHWACLSLSDNVRELTSKTYILASHLARSRKIIIVKYNNKECSTMCKSVMLQRLMFARSLTKYHSIINDAGGILRAFADYLWRIHH